MGPPALAEKAAPGRAWWVTAVLLAAVGLAGWYMSHPKGPKQALPAVFVNGAPKEKTSESGKPERWADVPVTVNIDTSVQALGPEAVAAVQAGFGAWVATDASLPSLTFDSVSGLTPKLQPDGVNAVIFAPIDFPGHKQDLALTISFVDADTGRILEADVIVNSKKKLGVVGGQQAESGAEDDDGDDAHEVPGCSGTYDLQAVAAHEAGHFFGLGEDHEDSATTMFFKTGKCEIRKRDLETSDRAVMVGLYEKPAPPVEAGTDTGGGCGGASVVPVRRPGGAWGVVVVVGALALWRRRGSARRMPAWPKPS